MSGTPLHHLANGYASGHIDVVDYRALRRQFLDAVEREGVTAACEHWSAHDAVAALARGAPRKAPAPEPAPSLRGPARRALTAILPVVLLAGAIAATLLLSQPREPAQAPPAPVPGEAGVVPGEDVGLPAYQARPETGSTPGGGATPGSGAPSLEGHPGDGGAGARRVQPPPAASPAPEAMPPPTGAAAPSAQRPESVQKIGGGQPLSLSVAALPGQRP